MACTNCRTPSGYQTALSDRQDHPCQCADKHLFRVQPPFRGFPQGSRSDPHHNYPINDDDFANGVIVGAALGTLFDHCTSDSSSSGNSGFSGGGGDFGGGGSESSYSDSSGSDSSSSD